MPAVKRNRVVSPRIMRCCTSNRVVFLPIVYSCLSYRQPPCAPAHAHPTSLEVLALSTCGPRCRYRERVVSMARAAVGVIRCQSFLHRQWYSFRSFWMQPDDDSIRSKRRCAAAQLPTDRWRKYPHQRDECCAVALSQQDGKTPHFIHTLSYHQPCSQGVECAV
jgi:hypothetical protein